MHALFFSPKTIFYSHFSPLEQTASPPASESLPSNAACFPRSAGEGFLSQTAQTREHFGDVVPAYTHRLNTVKMLLDLI